MGSASRRGYALVSTSLVCICGSLLACTDRSIRPIPTTWTYDTCHNENPLVVGSWDVLFTTSPCDVVHLTHVHSPCVEYIIFTWVHPGYERAK